MKSLIRSAGKFVYPKGSSLPAHFMPLQDFSLEMSLNYSLLIALRVARTEQHNGLLSYIEIRKWRHRLLTEEAADLIKACKFEAPCFHDYGSDYALIFEELKLVCAEIGEFEYVTHLSDPGREHHLSILHSDCDRPIQIQYHPLASFELDRHSVVVVNTVLGYRPQHDAPPPLESVLLGNAQGCILALRTCESEDAQVRTTIYGDDVIVPTLASVQRWMIETGRPWYWRWLPHHDIDFFLPETNAPDAGVLLAYTSDYAEKRPYFQFLTTGNTSNG